MLPWRVQLGRQRHVCGIRYNLKRAHAKILSICVTASACASLHVRVYGIPCGLRVCVQCTLLVYVPAFTLSPCTCRCAGIRSAAMVPEDLQWRCGWMLAQGAAKASLHAGRLCVAIRCFGSGRSWRFSMQATGEAACMLAHVVQD